MGNTDPNAQGIAEEPLPQAVGVSRRLIDPIVHTPYHGDKLKHPSEQGSVGEGHQGSAVNQALHNLASDAPSNKVAKQAAGLGSAGNDEKFNKQQAVEGVELSLSEQVAQEKLVADDRRGTPFHPAHKGDSL